MPKKWTIPAAASVSFLLVLAVVILSGILTVPTQAALQSAAPVESRDILADQYQRELDILNDYAAAPGSYTPQTPYLLQDPYQANPLSALILFETFQPAQVMVTVLGSDAFNTYAYHYNQFKTPREIAVLGLYPAGKVFNAYQIPNAIHHSDIDLSLIISSRAQSIVVKFSYREMKTQWILGVPDYWEGAYVP